MKTKHEKIGTIDVTTADMALLGSMFAITNHIATNPSFLSGDFDLIGNVASMIVSGTECKSFINMLHDIESTNKEDIHQFRKERSETIATIATNLMLSSVLEGNNHTLESIIKRMESIKSNRESVPDVPTGYQ